MKRVCYSTLQKVQTLVASIVLGCPHTKAINRRLVPDQVAAQEWSMERFPDQSQINPFLNRMTDENVTRLARAHRELLLAHSQLRSAPIVVVDLDQTGLTVTGKKFGLAGKGYFPRRRGSRKYQLSTALAAAERDRRRPRRRGRRRGDSRLCRAAGLGDHGSPRRGMGGLAGALVAGAAAVLYLATRTAPTEALRS
jgi:hypothetical protein